jgi:triacylglycerol lipase
MGGLVIREAIQNRGLAGRTNTAVTIATPHAGTPLARFVPGPSARQMRPGSDFLAGLQNHRADGRTRWMAVHGGADRVVPHDSVAFDIRSARVLKVHESTSGHGSVARHPEVLSAIVRELVRSEEVATGGFSLAA